MAKMTNFACLPLGISTITLTPGALWAILRTQQKGLGHLATPPVGQGPPCRCAQNPTSGKPPPGQGGELQSPTRRLSGGHGGRDHGVRPRGVSYPAYATPHSYAPTSRRIAAAAAVRTPVPHVHVGAQGGSSS